MVRVSRRQSALTLVRGSGQRSLVRSTGQRYGRVEQQQQTSRSRKCTSRRCTCCVLLCFLLVVLLVSQGFCDGLLEALGIKWRSFHVKPTRAVCFACFTGKATPADCPSANNVWSKWPFSLSSNYYSDYVEHSRVILDHYHVSRWVFGVDTGHAGTQTLSREECFEPVMDQLVWDFEAHHRYGDGREKRDLGLKVWYAELARLFPSSRKMESRRFVEQVLLPDSLFHAKWLSKRPSTNLTFIDLGHHINLGLMGPLASLLMPNISFVRVIRSRYDTVRSFLAESKRPCYSGMWTLCPLWHPDIVLKPPSAGVWRQLNAEQHNLWFIDEVEARWQQLLSRHPTLPHITVRWCNGEQFVAAWDAVARFIGNGAIRRKACPHHTHGQANLSDAALDAMDKSYENSMKYTSANLQLIKGVRRPNDCPA